MNEDEKSNEEISEKDIPVETYADMFTGGFSWVDGVGIILCLIGLIALSMVA